MPRVISRLALSVALLAVLAAVIVVHNRSTHVSAAPLAQMHRCTNLQLAMSPVESNGALGTITEVYRIHKLFGKPCTLYGNPGAEMLDRNFVGIPTTTLWTGVRPTLQPRLVQVGPHDAFFGVQYNEVPSGTGSCPRVYYLLSIPPRDYMPDVTYAAPNGGYLTVCRNTLWVSPVEPSMSMIAG